MTDKPDPASELGAPELGQVTKEPEATAPEADAPLEQAASAGDEGVCGACFGRGVRSFGPDDMTCAQCDGTGRA